MNHKIVFFDVDGTITSHKDGTILESTKLAIQQLIKQGVHVVAATGRPLSMCMEIAALGIDTFITANGAYVKHKDTIVHQVKLKPSTVRDVMDFALVEKNALTFYSEKIHKNEIEHPTILKALNETLSLQEYPPTNKAAYKEEVFLMCLFADEQMIEKYARKFPKLTFKRWHPFIVNVLEQDVCKSLAIIKVLEFFKIDASEAMAFGDGGNDIDMLEIVDIGIAMGNAGEKLKNVADFITKDSDQNGIAYALEYFELI